MQAHSHAPPINSLPPPPRSCLSPPVVYPPTLLNCGASRSVPERSAAGTLISPALTASVTTVNTLVTWAFVNPPPGLPLTIGYCDGQIKARMAAWSAALGGL